MHQQDHMGVDCSLMCADCGVVMLDDIAVVSKLRVHAGNSSPTRNLFRAINGGVASFRARKESHDQRRDADDRIKLQVHHKPALRWLLDYWGSDGIELVANTPSTLAHSHDGEMAA